MPESELREDAPAVAGSPPEEPRSAERREGDGAEELVERLADAVGRLLEQFETARHRAERAEAAHSRLADALRDAGSGGQPEEVERRLQTLSEENRRLREVVEEARRRARRLRNRLRVVEDEL